ncbi:MAG: NAD+ synthase [Planctomycetes bacterium]|nr:NAD+ synthase [Planctomycetota bacterium]
MTALKIDCNQTYAYLKDFLAEEFEDARFTRAVIGVSGGVDSSLALILTAQVLGADKVRALFMPYKTSNPESKRHARLITDLAGVELMEIDISPQIDLYYDLFPKADAVRRGNKMARERMTILYDHSAAFNGLVVGTSNRTEILLGYGTLHGDTVSAINPLGSLYKTHVFALARFAGVPEEILSKPPSADLWAGQTDEEELGFTYEKVDQLLYHMIDLEEDEPALRERGFEPAFIEEVRDRVIRFAYKRRPSLIPEIPDDVLNPG